jgi:parvulin-like peptidyl-prolyl isomerase
LGYIKRGYMPDQFDRVAFAMEINAVSEVVSTKLGYHIIKVSDKKGGGVAPYEEARELIKKFLQKEEAKKRLAAHIGKLRGEANIEILLSE